MRGGVVLLLVTGLLPLGAPAARGAPGQVEWTQQFGTTRYDLAWATAAVGDAVYVAGFTNFALDGQHYHHRYDAFVRKVDLDGTVLWTRQFGSNGTDQVLAVSADEGGVTVVGSTDGRLPEQRAAGGVDAFVARFGPSGRQRWVRQFGTEADDRLTAVAGAADGSFVAGSTGGLLDERHGGPTDAFVAHVDRSGELVWLRQFGTRRAEEALGISARGARIYVVGWTAGGLGGDFLGGGSDGFVTAYDREGATRWTRQLGTAGIDRVTAVVAGADGLFVSGSTDGALPEQSPAGGLDAFAAGLGPGGGPRWFGQFGSGGDDDASAVAVDAGGVYVAGSASGPLPDGEWLGEWDGFVRRLLSDGTPIWTRQLGTTDYDRVYGLSVDTTGLSLAGTTHGAFEGHVNAGDRDVFLVRVSLS
jgi:hypothetical protein